METIIWKVFQIVFPIYACVGLGYFLGRVKVPWESKSAGWLVLNVGLTCLVIAKLAETHATSDEIVQIISAGFLAIIAFLILGSNLDREVLMEIQKRIDAEREVLILNSIIYFEKPLVLDTAKKQ